MANNSERAAYITTTKGGAGWFAIHVWWNPDMGGFWEPWQTGIGRYATRQEAEAEGRTWAEAEDMQFREEKGNDQ